MIPENLIEVLEVMEKEKQIFEVFQTCPYHILRNIKLKKHAAKDFVLQQGQVYDTIYVIVEGEVEIYIESEQGKRFFFDSYSKGNFIGELEVLQHRPYMCSVVAVCPMVTLEMSRACFLEWIQEDIRFQRYFLGLLSDQHYTSLQEMNENILYTLKQRICQRLYESAKEKGMMYAMLSAEMIAERMGVTTRSVHRILKELREKGIIEIRKSSIVILDMEQLLKEKNEK